MPQITINSKYTLQELVKLFEHEKNTHSCDFTPTTEKDVIQWIEDRLNNKISEILIYGNPLKKQ